MGTPKGYKTKKHHILGLQKNKTTKEIKQG